MRVFVERCEFHCQILFDCLAIDTFISKNAQIDSSRARVTAIIVRSTHLKEGSLEERVQSCTLQCIYTGDSSVQFDQQTRARPIGKRFEVI